MSEMLLEATGITKRYSGVIALNGVDVHQTAGETLGMIGPNGSGKTTFVNVVTGHAKVTSGRVRFGENVITNKRPNQLGEAGLTRTYQAVRVFGQLSGWDNVKIAVENAARPLVPAAIEECVDWLGLSYRLDVLAGSLTLYEQRRLELLTRLVQQPRLIMLDEPVGGLSSSEARAMIALLGELKARCSIFLIEHSMRVIRELADRVVVLIAGEKLAEGHPAEVLRDARVIESYLGSADA